MNIVQYILICHDIVSCIFFCMWCLSIFSYTIFVMMLFLYVLVCFCRRMWYILNSFIHTYVYIYIYICIHTWIYIYTLYELVNLNLKYCTMMNRVIRQIVQHNVINVTVLFRRFWCCIVLYCIVLYCIVLYCIVLYCIVLYCIVLYCTIFSFSTLCVI